MDNDKSYNIGQLPLQIFYENLPFLRGYALKPYRRTNIIAKKFKVKIIDYGFFTKNLLKYEL